MSKEQIENEMIKNMLIGIAKQRNPHAKIDPAGTCHTLRESVTIDDLNDYTLAMLWYNIGKDTHGESVKLERKKEGDKKMPANLTTRTLTGNIKIITNPELIKVKTIKKKYVDQLRFCPLTTEGYEDFDIVGQTQGYIIVKIKDGLAKISIADYRLEMIRLYQIQKPECSNQESMDYAQGIIDQIPQLFAD